MQTAQQNRGTQQKMTFVEASPVDETQSKESTMLQLSKKGKKRGTGGGFGFEDSAWKPVVRGLFVVFAITDAVIVGLLINHWLLSR